MTVTERERTERHWEWQEFYPFIICKLIFVIIVDLIMRSIPYSIAVGNSNIENCYRHCPIPIFLFSHLCQWKERKSHFQCSIRMTNVYQAQSVWCIGNVGNPFKLDLIIAFVLLCLCLCLYLYLFAHTATVFSNDFKNVIRNENNVLDNFFLKKTHFFVIFVLKFVEFFRVFHFQTQKQQFSLLKISQYSKNWIKKKNRIYFFFIFLLFENKNKIIFL